MIRAFSQHRLRKTSLLDGPWDFVTDPENQGLAEKWFLNFPLQNARRMHVPACWNNEIGLYSYEGVAWYRQFVEASRTQHTRLVFHGVLGHADVYLDGRHLGYHYGGFSPFEIVLPDLSKGRHELVVRTDNTHTRDTIPLDKVDWYHYGGIIRSVEWQELPAVYIQKLKVDYAVEFTGPSAVLNLVAELKSLAGQTTTVTLQWSRDNITFLTTEVIIPPGQAITVNEQVSWDQVKLWDTQNPNLYLLGLQTGQDDLYDRVGFRTVEVKAGRILLNRQPVLLKGVNRHEEHPEWGFAFPPRLMSKDLDIIQKLGCNFVRGSHYPNSQYFMDLLDERGILFWEEIPLWGYPQEVLTDQVILSRALQMNQEMIERDYNRPSVIMWGTQNEMDTRGKEGLALVEAIAGLVRSLDKTRLVTGATMFPLDDITLHLYDVIGINQYFGWYRGNNEDWPNFLEQFHTYAAGKGAGDRPIIMSEFGGAAIYGSRGWEDDRMFSEEYQATILSKALNSFFADPKIAGTCIWQYADIRSDTRRFRDRARGFNNKGLVNEYRQPKHSYWSVQQIYQSQEI